MDGVLAMEGNGPASKDLINLGKIMAGNDSVAVDTVVAYIMGFPDLPRTIALAAAKGYGICELSRINILGELQVIPGFKLPQMDQYLTTVNTTMNSITAVRPWVDKELCSLCETCIEHCPGKALTMNEYPVVNPELCITCFCCQELCPQKAIELK